MITKLCSKQGVLLPVCLISACLLANEAVAVSADDSTTDQLSSHFNLQTGEAQRENFRLQRWLRRYVADHPTVLAARAAVVSADYRLQAADKALYNPALEFDAEKAETRSASIGFSQTIDWGNIRGARTEMAGSQKNAASLGFTRARYDIAASLLKGLADYHSSAALRQLAEQGNALMQRSARLAKQRFEAGDLGQVEVDLANLSYAQARFQLADAVSEHARAKQKLVALTASSGDDWPSLNIDFIAPDSNGLSIDKTVQQLPQMREILARVQAAQSNVKVQIGEKASKPTIALRAGKEEQSALLGINLSIPLTIRNDFQAEVDVANAEMIQAEKQSMVIYRQLKSRLVIATISYQLSRDAWLVWLKSGEGTLQEQIRLLERLWKAGEINTTNYLLQLKQALDTKADAIRQRGRMWSDWSEWLVASGYIEQLLDGTSENNTGDR